MSFYTNLLYSLSMHAFTTFFESFFGLLLGALVSITIFLWTTKYPKLSKIGIYFILILQIIPFIALAPLAVLIFGFSIYVKIGIVAWMAFFPCFLSMSTGFKELSGSLVYLFNTLEANQKQKLFHLYLPFLRPYFFSGFKSAGIWAVSAAISAEGLGSEKGLGVYFAKALSLFRIDLVFYGAAASALCGILLYAVVVLLDLLFQPRFQRNFFLKKELL